MYFSNFSLPGRQWGCLPYF